MTVTGLNHAVLYVADAQRSARFYERALGMEVVSDLGDAVFLALPDSGNHHDLGLFSLGGEPRVVSRHGIGLYHLAWSVDSFESLRERRAALIEMGALAGESDHVASLSLYGYDHDGIEFEIMWATPPETWAGVGAVTRPLDWSVAERRFAG